MMMPFLTPNPACSAGLWGQEIRDQERNSITLFNRMISSMAAASLQQPLALVVMQRMEHGKTVYTVYPTVIICTGRKGYTGS